MSLKESESREGAVPTPELENLAKYLLVPRKPRGFKKVDGRVEFVNSDSDISIAPVVTVNSSHADLVGLRSGRRSGLLNVEGVGGETAIKVKGCRILSALKADGSYIITRFSDGGSPEGGQTLSAVQREIDNTRLLNELFSAEGFPVPYNPEAIIHYGVMFNPNGRSEHAEELAASVMRIIGDTRLAELYRLEVRSFEAARKIAFRLGVIAGAQKRVTNGFYWNDSQSVGNYVVFVEGDQLHLSTVDFDDTIPYENVDIPAEIQYLSTRNDALHYPGWLKSLKELALSEAPDLERHAIARIFGTMRRSSLSFVEGNRLGRPGFYIPDEYKHTVPSYFRGKFEKGFKEGYKHSDRRKPIPVADLVVAYGLKV